MAYINKFDTPRWYDYQQFISMLILWVASEAELGKLPSETSYYACITIYFLQK